MNTSSSPPKVDVIYVSPLSLWRRSVCQTLSEASLISSATARVAPSLLKVSAILSGTTVRRAAVEREDLKLNCKSGKRSHFPKWSTYLLFTSFSKVLLRPFPNIPKYRDHRWDLPTIMKLRFMRKFKIHPGGSCEKLQLIYIYESSGLQFFRTTTGIQSGRDAFEESRSVIIFVTNLEFMGVLCCFRLFLEGISR